MGTARSMHDEDIVELKEFIYKKKNALESIPDDQQHTSRRRHLRIKKKGVPPKKENEKFMVATVSSNTW